MFKADKKGTKYAAFNGDGSLFNTPTAMGGSQNSASGYSDQAGFSLAEIPYRGNDISMVVIAPNDPSGIAKLQSEISSENLSKWIGALKNARSDSSFLSSKWKPISR